MARTRIREHQTRDEDFLTEQEGEERFILKNESTAGSIILDGYIDASDLRIDGNSLTESGTFAPIVKIGETIQTLDYSLGYYTRVKDIITVTVSVGFTNSINEGTISVEGLPFISKNVENLVQYLTTNPIGFVSYVTFGGAHYENVRYGSTDKPLIMAKVYPNSSKMVFGYVGLTGDLAVLVPNSPIVFNITGSYIIDE